MSNFERLTKNRQIFLESLKNLINSSFLEQEKVKNWKDEEKRPIQRIFINAAWGMGKTLFANALQESFQEDETMKTIYINAWKMDFYKDFYKAFYGEVSLTETIDEKLEDVGSSIVDVGVSLSKIVLNSYLNKEIGINIKKTLEELNLEKLKGEKYFLLEDYFSHIKNLDELKDSFLNEEGKKVIIIDELDRCRPDYAIYLLEEIKHIFDIKNMIF